MASDIGFVEYVCEQIRGAGHVSHRRMFGEFAVYCDGKVVALVCDNQFFLKPTDAGKALLDRVQGGAALSGRQAVLPGRRTARRCRGCRCPGASHGRSATGTCGETRAEGCEESA